MKPFKILLWLGISFALGKALDFLFSPSEVIYSFFLFAFPFVLMGFQRDIKTFRSSSSLFGKRFRVKTQTTTVTTFWGIPIGQPETSDIVDEWLPDTTPKEVLEGLSAVTESVLGGAVEGIFKKFQGERKSLSGY